MVQFEILTFVVSLVALQVALILYIWDFIAVSLGKKQQETAASISRRPAHFTLLMLAITWLFLTTSLVTRSLITGHVPFTDMYGFAASFCWGVLLAAMLFQWKLKAYAFGAGGSIIALALLLYAFFLPAEYAPLSPALRQTWLLPFHVSCAIMAYGMFALGFASAILYLVRQKYSPPFLPDAGTLDRGGYLSVITGFPLITLVIIVGAIWAQIAWGSYWSWDPKETASLVTWIIYAVYFVTRLFFGWQGRRSALLLIVGFLAVLVTFFGNLFFGGLHGYGH